MPGSYPDPRYYANTAIQILEEAYEESQGSPVAARILDAIDALIRLKEEIKAAQLMHEHDPYELNEANSAL